MALTKFCKLLYTTETSVLSIQHTATGSATLNYSIKDTENSTELTTGTIAHDTLTALNDIIWIASGVNNTEYDLYLEDTVPVINLSCKAVENENLASYVEFYPTHPILINLTTFICNYNHLLTTGLTFPDFANALNLVNVNNNQLTSATQDAIILAVWNNAIRKQQLSKTFNILSNDGTYSAQSAAYLTALNDNATFKWTINTVAPAGTGFTNIDSVEDLQTLAVNKTVAALQTKDFDASVTHTWGINKPTYQLIIPTTITTGTVAAVVNGNITFGATTYQVCGVYFDHTQTLKGFYVNSTASLTGAGNISQGAPAFAATAYDCYPINHYYADLTTTYATEKARFGIINDAALYNLSDAAAQRVVGYNDAMSRIYYMGQTIGDNTQAKTGFVPIGTAAAPFTGSYNCQGFKITNLLVNSNARYVGMIGQVTGNKTSQLCLINDITIDFGYEGTDSRRIGIVGALDTLHTLTTSYINGTVYATGNSALTSVGPVGVIVSISSIKNSYTNVNLCVFCRGLNAIGGLVGYELASSIITNSFGYGDVYLNGVKLTTATNPKLQAVGTADADCKNFNVYQLAGATYNVGSTYICRGLTAAQFKDKANFATVTANYTGLAGITIHQPTAQYLQKTFVYNTGTTKIYICNTLINAAALTANSGTIAITNTSFWTEMVLNAETPVTVDGMKYTYAGGILFAALVADEEYTDITTHNSTFRAYANTGRTITADGKCYVALQNVPLNTAITNTPYWLQDTGYNFTDTWRMMWDYPKLKTFQLQPVVLQQYINGDN